MQDDTKLVEIEKERGWVGLRMIDENRLLTLNALTFLCFFVLVPIRVYIDWSD